ncbi:MAG: Minf_1886 family protein, partial [Planctomycetaceae bacterium]
MRPFSPCHPLLSAMNSTHSAPPPRLSFHPNAYRVLQISLERTQKSLGRRMIEGGDEGQAHISGGELLLGIRDYALDQFGLMAKTVFHQWGLRTTDDFGRLVFEMIDRGDLRK